MRLLVSVRNVLEAEDAILGGADVIDVKEPSRGSLGAADASIGRDIVACVGGRRSVSVVIGDMGIATAALQRATQAATTGADVVKVGFAGVASREASTVLATLSGAGIAYFIVAYADHHWAHAPSAEDLLRAGERHRAVGILLDTWRKDHGSLLQVADEKRMAAVARAARRQGLAFGIAGGLGVGDVDVARALGVDVFGVRGAACAGDRTSRISRARVADLARAVQGSTTGALPRSA